MRQRFYLAEQGLYESTSVVGIFDSPERAIAALHRQGDVWTKTTWTNYPDYPDRTTTTHSVSWSNDKDWDAHVEIREIVFTNAGPRRHVDRALVQTYRESDGGWDYLPERMVG